MGREQTRGLSQRSARSEIHEVENAGGSTPDDALLIEEVIDDFDAITHLDLGLF